MSEVPCPFGKSLPRDPNPSRSGYKEEQHLVVVNGPHEASYRDEEEEDPHGDDSSDDVNAGHQTQALAPGGHANEQ